MHGGSISGESSLAPGMTRSKRANGAGSVYIKHGSYYGRWITADGGRAESPARPGATAGIGDGLTRKQAERRLRELMDEVQVTTDATGPSRRRASAARAPRGDGPLEVAPQTVESHLRVHIAPLFKEKPIDRLTRRGHHPAARRSFGARQGAEDDPQRPQHAALGLRSRGPAALVTPTRAACRRRRWSSRAATSATSSRTSSRRSSSAASRATRWGRSSGRST